MFAAVLACAVFIAIWGASKFYRVDQENPVRSEAPPVSSSASPDQPAASAKARTNDAAAEELYQAGKQQLETRSLDGVKHTLIEGGLLTVLIVFLFLRSWR